MTNILEYSQKASERQFKSAIGRSRVEFAELYKDFELVFIELTGSNYETYLEDRVTEPVKLPTLESCLFFVLYQLKNDLVYDSSGMVFQMGGSTAHDNFQKYSAILKETLKKKKYIPNESLEMLKNLKIM